MSSCLETDPVQKARDMDLEVKYPAADELFIDIDDGKTGLRHMQECLEIIEKELPGTCVISRITTSKSGGKHVVLRWFKPLENDERIMLQAILGSDRLRELFSVLHLFKGTLIQPTIFFEVKGAKNEHVGPAHATKTILRAGRVGSDYFTSEEMTKLRSLSKKSSYFKKPSETVELSKSYAQEIHDHDWSDMGKPY